MDTDTKQVIKDTFKGLSKEVQEAILSVGFNQKLTEISKKYNLQVDQMTALENETLFVMLGIQHPKKYIKHLKEEMEIEAEQAKKIAQEVNTGIFHPIRESLKKMHSIEEGDENKPIRSKKNKGEEIGNIDEKEVKKEIEAITNKTPETEAPPDNLPIEDIDETLDRTELIEEIENPPRYGIDQFSKNAESEKEIKTRPSSEDLETNSKNKTKTDDEKRSVYGDHDPYREPIN